MASEDKTGFVSWLVLASLAVLPCAFATGFTQFEFLKESISFVLGGLILAGWGVGVLRGKLIRFEGGRIATVLIALALFALLGVAWSPSTNLGYVGASQWLVAMALFVAVIAPVGRGLTLSDVVPALAVGTSLAGLVGILDLAGLGLTTEVWDPPGAAGAFDAREFAIAYYAMALPLLAVGGFTGKGKSKGLAWVGVALGAVHFATVVSALTAGIYAVVLVISAGLAAVFQGGDAFKTHVLKPLIALLVVTGAGVGFALVGPDPGGPNEATELPWIGETHPRTKTDQSKPVDPRFAIPRIEEMPDGGRGYVFAIALDLLREEPIVGHGPNSWWFQQTKYPRPDDEFVKTLQTNYPAFRAPHNGLALTMAELGGVGLLLFLVWLSTLGGIGITAFASKTEPDEWLAEHFGLTAAVGAGVALMVVTPALQLAAPAALFFVAAGLFVRRATSLNDNTGMSVAWHINKDGKRWDTSFFCGVLPVALGLAVAGIGAWWGTFTYYRSWGDLAMLRTQDALAIDKYSLVNDLMPGDPDTLFNTAIAYRRMGDFENARDVLNEAVSLREFDVRIINLVALLHLKDHKYADAVKASRQASELYPNHWESREALAAALSLQGRLADAAKELLTILEYHPSDAERGKVHMEVGDMYAGSLDNPAKAVEHYEEALKYIESAFVREHVKTELEVVQKEVERRRLQREGKPIPPELLPKQPADPHGHGHGGHDGHGH